jgi:chromosome segregation ATPase
MQMRSISGRRLMAAGAVLSALNWSALFAQTVAEASGSKTAPPLAQTSPAPPAPSGDLGSDKFQSLRDNADRLRGVYEKLDTTNSAEIDGLLRTKRCQSLRVNGDLDRIVDSLNQWNEAELKYWTVWADEEAGRVAGQEKSLASMEAEQRRAEELVTSSNKDREDLLRAKANLEKFGNRTAEIRKQIEGLVQDIKDSEERLSEAQKSYDDVAGKVRNIKASIGTRLVDMRQNKQRVEAFGLQMKSYYEETRAAEQEICNAGTPATKTQFPQPKKSN